MGSIFSQIMTMGDKSGALTSRSYRGLLKSKKKTGSNHAFFRGNFASIWRKTLKKNPAKFEDSHSCRMMWSEAILMVTKNVYLGMRRKCAQ